MGCTVCPAMRHEVDCRKIPQRGIYSVERCRIGYDDEPHIMLADGLAQQPAGVMHLVWRVEMKVDFGHSAIVR